MERFIKLNLRDDSAKAEAVNTSRPDEAKPPLVSGKTINMMANKAAHKAASNFARNSSSGIFSK